MAMPVNSQTYNKMIEEDVEWLKENGIDIDDEKNWLHGKHIRQALEFEKRGRRTFALCGRGYADEAIDIVRQADARIAEQQRVIDEIKSALRAVVDQLSVDSKVFNHENFEIAMKQAKKLIGENNG